MKWTNKKPKTYGVYWWKNRKKSKAYLVYVEDAKLVYIKCTWVSIIFPVPESSSLVYEEETRDQFDTWTDIEDINGYWSDAQITRPSGYN